MLIPSLAMVLAASPARAQEVLVPEFTPAIAEDFTLAYMFGSLVGDQLRERDVAFADGEELRAMAGEDASQCAESITCPSALWGYYPNARIAVVGTVGLYNQGTPEERIEVTVQLYPRDGYEPLKEVERALIPGEEGEFAAAIARAVAFLLEHIDDPAPASDAADGSTAEAQGERPGLLGRVRQRPGAAGEGPQPGAQESGEPYRSYYQPDEPVPAPTEPERASAREPKPARQARPVRAKAPREERGPRGEGRVRVGGTWDRADDHRVLRAEIASGLVGGDVARTYDLRMAYAGPVGAEIGRYEHDTFTGGVGWTLAMGLYGAPWPWLRVGARLGLLTGRKFLSTGYERWADGGLTTADTQAYEPASAMRGLIEPRIVLAPVRLGAVRPSATALLGLRAYDAFTVTDLVDVDFPDRPGGWQVEPGFALGASYDLGGGRWVCAELGHSWRVGAASVHHVERGLITDTPQIPATKAGSTFLIVSFTQGFVQPGAGR
ncbi:MAG: hypothetical protein ABIO70_27800 [Pseudomonadota bacterium]